MSSRKVREILRQRRIEFDKTVADNRETADFIEDKTEPKNESAPKKKTSTAKKSAPKKTKKGE